LGVAEGRRDDIDLVSLFKEVCRMEERFREEVKRYIRRPGSPRITPRDIPPLISISGNLPPTAKNKMFNAVIKSKNFGGEISTPTQAPLKSESLKHNIQTLRTLLATARSLGKPTLGGLSTDGEVITATCLVYEVSTSQLTEFLSSYRWLESVYRE